MANKTAKGKFQPGKSGNPGGRPKAIVEVRELARAHTELAVITLAEIAGNADLPAAARVTAASAILDRGWGRPMQEIEHKGEEGGPIVIRWLPPEK